MSKFKEIQEGKWEIQYEGGIPEGSVSPEAARDFLRLVAGIIFLLDSHYSPLLTEGALKHLADSLRPAAMLLLRGTAHKHSSSEREIIENLIKESQKNGEQ